MPTSTTAVEAGRRPAKRRVFMPDGIGWQNRHAPLIQDERQGFPKLPGRHREAAKDGVPGAPRRLGQGTRTGVGGVARRWS